MTDTAKDTQAPTFPLDELSTRTGESAERLQEWQALGLVGAPDRESYGPPDVACAQLIRGLLRLGVGVEAIAEAAERKDPELQFFLNWCDFDQDEPLYSIAHVAEVTGFDLDQLRRLLEAMGIHGRDDALKDEDINALQSSKIALDAGFAEDGLLQLLRVFSDALGRAAEATQRTAHIYMFDRMMTSGLPRSDIQAEIDDAEGSINPLLEPTVLYFLRRELLRASREDSLTHLAQHFGTATRRTCSVGSRAVVPGVASAV